MAIESPRIRTPRSSSFSLLVILGAIATLIYGAVLFSNTMSTQIVDVALKVAMSDQLNTTTFIARELGDEHALPRVGRADLATVYQDKFDNFMMRHGLAGYVVDANSFEALAQKGSALNVDLEFVPPIALQKMIERGPLSQAIASRRKLQGVVVADDARYLTSLVPITGTSHTVVVYRSEQPIITAAVELTNRFTGYLLAAFSLVLVLFTIFMRTLTLPLRQLTQAAEEIGAGQLDQHLEVKSNTEVGLLAQAFNQMSRELRVKYRELANTSQRLEDSNQRYRDILVEYERQNGELTLLNELVYEASCPSGSERDLESLTGRIQSSFGLLLVGLFSYRPRKGWELEHASDPLFETCDFRTGGLLAELSQMTQHRKIRIIPAHKLGTSRGSHFADRFASGICAIVPVTVQGQLEAAFILVAPGMASFNRETLAQFQRLTQQLGIIMHKDALLAETTKRREQLEKINRLGNALLAELEFDNLMPRVLMELNNYLGADQAVLVMADAPDTALVPVMAVEQSAQIPPHLHRLEQGWNTEIRLTGKPLLMREYPRADLWTQDGKTLDTGRVSRFQSFLGLPIREGARVTGVLAMLSEQPGHFDEDDTAFLEAVANHLSGAIVNARLFQEISTRDARRDVQLETAKQFQADRIPDSFEDGTIEVNTCLFPAEELAGDFFDVFRLSPNVTGMVIGDVASKGVAASLLTFSMLSHFRNFATHMRPPAKVMEMANITLREQNIADFWFVTAFYARINHTDMTMTYCKAGHVLPVLYRAADGSCELLDGDGLPLGILDEADYVTAQVDLAPGDRILLYTDGVIELKNEAGQQFGVERLCEVIKAHAHETPQALHEAIIEAHSAYASPDASRDDILIAAVAIHEDAWVNRELHYGDMDSIVDEILEAVETQPIDATTAYSVRLALNETIANAHLHGHGEDESKPIALAYRLTNSYFALVVKDCGTGFDYENLPDPTVPENLVLTHGRGIFLMRQMMDELEFNDSGNEIRMRKYFTLDIATHAREALAEANVRVTRAELDSGKTLRALSRAAE